MARSTTGGSIYRFARKRTSPVKQSRSMPQTKSLADKMDNKKFTSPADNLK